MAHRLTYFEIADLVETAFAIFFAVFKLSIQGFKLLLLRLGVLLHVARPIQELFEMLLNGGKRGALGPNVLSEVASPFNEFGISVDTLQLVFAHLEQAGHLIGT